MRASLSIVACLIGFAARGGAQNLCRFYLANQSASVEGFSLSLEANADSSGNCAVGSLNCVSPWATEWHFTT
jgi:hypothetical protein